MLWQWQRQMWLPWTALVVVEVAGQLRLPWAALVVVEVAVARLARLQEGATLQRQQQVQQVQQHPRVQTVVALAILLLLPPQWRP